MKLYTISAAKRWFMHNSAPRVGCDINNDNALPDEVKPRASESLGQRANFTRFVIKNTSWKSL